MVLEKSPAPPTPPSSPASTPAPAARRRRIPSLARSLIIGMLLLLTFLLASFAIRNSDALVRLATGRLIAQGEYQFGVDPFSFTTDNVYWANPSWLYDLLIYLIYQVAGGAGLVLVKAVLMAGLGWLLLSFRRAEQPVFVPAMVCALAIVVMSPRFMLQPMCVSLLFLGVSLYLVERSKLFARRLWLLPPLFLLWANIDGWFIFGLLLLAAYLAGSFMEGVDKERRKRLGLALLLSIVCCLINPHLWHVFTLPPELAYLAAQLSDTIRLGPPEGMMAAGRTWQVLRDNDAGFLLTLSPFSEEFRSIPGLGNNLAGKAYFALLLLGLLSFIPQFIPAKKAKWEGSQEGEASAEPRNIAKDNLETAVQEPRLPELRIPEPRPSETAPPGQPQLPECRRQRSWSSLALWLPAAVLSLFLARMVGFFAVVTAVVAIRNIQDYLEARAARDKATPRPTLLRELGAAVVLAILLALAWPGWVNGPFDGFSSARRVAWSIEPDESFRKAAERLGRLHGEGKARGGAALSLELANYLPWYAPGVKSYCDSRYELFPGVIADFYRIRRALSRDAGEYFTGKAPPLEIQFAEWRKLAERHNLDFVALTNFQGAEVTQQLTRRFWLEPELWPFLYGDGRTLVFGWNGAEQLDRFAGDRVNWNAAAFGKVPDDGRPPAQGTIPPEEASFLDRYLHGLPAAPLEGFEIQLYQAAYQFFGRIWVRAYFHAWQANALATAASMGAAIPGYVTAQPDLLPFLLPNPLVERLAQNLRAEDNGPPALPVLMVRAGRRGVAEAPRSAEGYLKLADACTTLWRMQENHWALDQGQERLEPIYLRSLGPQAVNYLNFRNTIRRVQAVAALKSSVRLDPDNWRVHEILGEMFTESYYLDVALEHFSEALASFERRRPADPQLQDAYRDKLAQLQSRVKRYDAVLKKRKADYDLRASGKNPLERYAIALRQPFRSAEMKKDEIDLNGMGLSRPAIFALRAANANLGGQREDFFIVANQLDMLLMLGEVQLVDDALKNESVRKLLGPASGYYQTVWAAAVGDYQHARAALTSQIEQFATATQIDRIRTSLILKMAPAHNVGELAMQANWFRDNMLGLYTVLQRSANLHLLRGLMALEQGDTSAATRDFRTCLDMTAAVFLPDRPIAERYHALLDAQK